MPSIPVHLLEPGADPTEMPAAYGRSSRWRSLLLWIGIPVVAALAALWWFKLPPFSPPQSVPVLAAQPGPGTATSKATASPTPTGTVTVALSMAIDDRRVPPRGWVYVPDPTPSPTSAPQGSVRFYPTKTPIPPAAPPYRPPTQRPAYPGPDVRTTPTATASPTPTNTPTPMPTAGAMVYRCYFPLAVWGWQAPPDPPGPYRVYLPVVGHE